MIKEKVFENETILNPTGTYENCKFDNVTFKGIIDCVLKNCIVIKCKFFEPEILRFETPGTDTMGITVVKRKFQPIHYVLTKVFFLHDHKFITDKMKGYALTIKDEDLDLYFKIIASANHIFAHKEQSWNDFLFSEPKEVWDLAEKFFADVPEMIKVAVIVREKRWPKEK